MLHLFKDEKTAKEVTIEETSWELVKDIFGVYGEIKKRVKTNKKGVWNDYIGSCSIKTRKKFTFFDLDYIMASACEIWRNPWLMDW